MGFDCRVIVACGIGGRQEDAVPQRLEPCPGTNLFSDTDLQNAGARAALLAVNSTCELTHGLRRGLNSFAPFGAVLARFPHLGKASETCGIRGQECPRHT